MLSFDITDRNIRIIKGTESGGKIKISAAASLSLEEAVIVNGHVNDINRVAMMINQVLKTNNMFDKEAIVSISSNQTVFKELMIPPNAKEHEFMKSVRQELQMQINVDDSYAVAYVIVGEPEENENGERLQRILTTACPYDVVDCYKRVFHMLGISLKSMMIGCNSITKVLLADVKIKAKMPLLAVQIDKNFISLNLYENSQLSFSRFASIDPEDYDDPEDYVFQAVNENIFRMLQFSRSRGGDQIENVIFFGDLNASEGLYNRLIDEMSENDITVSQLKPPPQIHGYQNLEFSEYANAIGAMFKRNKLTEHINLLETEGGAAAKAKGGKSFAPLAVACVAVSVILVGGVYLGMLTVDNNVKDKTTELQTAIDSPETAAGLKLYEDLKVQRDTVAAYKRDVSNASAAYNSMPIVNKDMYDALDDALAQTAGSYPNVSYSQIDRLSVEDGVITADVTIRTTEEFSQKYPAAMVQYLYDTYSNQFEAVDYVGYTAEYYTDDAAGSGTPEGAAPGTVTPNVPANVPDGTREVKFSLEIYMKQHEVPELPTEAPTEAETTAAAE